MYAFCERHGIPHERSGKVIVATDAAGAPAAWRSSSAGAGPTASRACAVSTPSEHPGARAPRSRARRPCIHPTPGSSTSAPSRARLADELREAGGVGVDRLRGDGRSAGHRGLRLTHAHGRHAARHAVFCAGAWADRLASPPASAEQPRIVPFRGAYLRLAPERRRAGSVADLPRARPLPALPRRPPHAHIDGEVLVGPDGHTGPGPRPERGPLGAAPHSCSSWRDGPAPGA